MKEFTSSNIDLVQSDIKAALACVAEKHGVSIKFGIVRYSADSYGTRMEVFAADGGDVAQVEFNKYCGKFGIKPSAYGSTFVSRGTEYTVCGIKPRAKGYPIVAVNARGTRYKFEAKALNDQFKLFKDEYYS